MAASTPLVPVGRLTAAQGVAMAIFVAMAIID
jgi:hypothetical protein